jgi:hypothetical protein
MTDDQKNFGVWVETAGRTGWTGVVHGKDVYPFRYTEEDARAEASAMSAPAEARMFPDDRASYLEGDK